MSEPTPIKPVFDLKTTYEKWLDEEGLPVIKGFFVEDLKSVEVAPWKRKGGKGTYINLEGTGGTNDAYIAEIPAGGNLRAEKCMFEEVIYVLSGRGATTIWNEGGKKQTFEWQADSLFAPPLNVWRQHFNGQGDQPARLMSVTTAPMMINIFHNMDYIFNSPYVFKDRYSGEDDYFSAEGKLYNSRLWESNFIPDVASFQVLDKSWRGAGGKGMAFELANNTTAAHISEFPVGTYKNGHRHGPGAHVVILAGEGYSLLWQEGKPKIRVDWRPGSLFVPPDLWFHQHFNVGPTPARYLAITWGSHKFRMAGTLGLTSEKTMATGNQIPYANEDPEIRRMFEAALAKRGVASRMAEFFEKR